MGNLWNINRLTIFLIILISALLSVISGCTLLPKEEKALKPPLDKPVKQHYEFDLVKRGTITKELKNNAAFVSNMKQELFFKSSGGRLKGILVSVGDEVKKGDVVAQLDPEEYENQVFIQKRNLEKLTISYQQSEQLNPNDAVSLHLKKIEIELAKNELIRLNAALTKTKLISTIDGEVTFVSDLKEGDYMVAYATVVSISNPKQVQLLSQFPDPGKLTGVNVGMKVDVTVDSDSYTGHILQAPSSVPLVNNREQRDKNAMTLMISIDGLPEGDYLGKFAEIVIILEQKDNTLIVPEKAVTTFLGRNFVYVLDGEIRREVDVEKGIIATKEVEIIKGLKEGEKVIIGG
jgi:RND family efflux transporter MFP subunit